MHNNYYFLKQLSHQLDDALRGYSIIEAFSQNKNELILGFAKQNDEFFIKAHLDPAFCCLSFPQNFMRARKNSVDLFKDIILHKIESVYQFKNERSFMLCFESGYKLLFKMHGNRSNIVLFDDDDVAEVFKKSLRKDHDINLSELDRDLDQSYQAFVEHEGNYKKLYPTFGKVINSFLSKKLEGLDIEQKWKIIESTVASLENPSYYVTKYDGSLQFSLIEVGAVEEMYADPIQGLDQFFIQYISRTTLENTKNAALSEIKKQLKQSESYVKKNRRKLEEIESRLNYSMLADIIMANLHRIPSQSSEVTLDNFYDENKPIEIKLKQGLSPQKNAELYYRKAKNQSVEIENLKSNIKNKESIIDNLEFQILQIEEEQNLKVLRNLVKNDDTFTSKKKEHLPFNRFRFGGFDIWVGKNSRSNDRMLQQHSFKEDLWLHAKDASGSHVLIKHKAGQVFPKDVIEKGAELAAYFSKRKSDTLCPVIVTPRKYVRKRKGDPAGAVMVDKEEKVVLVRPNNWS